jgi:hypothetical protein
MTTSAQWAGNEKEFWVHTKVVREKISSVAYKLIFVSPPTPGDMTFLSDKVGRAFMKYLVGTPLANWNYDYHWMEVDDEAFTTYIEVCSRVLTEIKEKEVAAWFISGIVTGCLSFFANLSMSANKYGKIVKEMKETLPEARLPMIEEITGSSKYMRDVLALTVASHVFSCCPKWTQHD